MIRLGPITQRNCDIVRYWRNDFRQSLRTSILLTQEMQTDFYNRISHDRKSEDRYWEVYNEAAFVGLGGLTDIEWENSLAEISLFIDPEVQHAGIGTEAVRALCEEGFLRMGLKTILGEAFKCNPNWKFWEKLTLKFGGYMTELPNRKFWNGEHYPSLYFSWDASDNWR